MTERGSAVEGLEPLPAAILEAFDAVAPEVEAEVTRRCLEEDDPTATMGAEAEEMIRVGMGFVTKMVRASMAFASRGILESELKWGETRLPVYGVTHEMTFKNFARYLEALERRLPAETFGALRPYFDHLIARQGQILGEGGGRP